MHNPDKDFNYKGYDVAHLPHPKLKGTYEIYLGDIFIDRAENKKEAKRIIDNHIKLQEYAYTNFSAD